MSLRIQNNVEAFNAHRNLSGTENNLATSMERLSSGYRINRAADDAAGLAISERLRGQIGGLDQAQRNSQDAVSMVQTAEGSLTEVHSMLQRVRDLAVQYKNGSLSANERAAIYQENLTASESRIRDVDMASEMVNFTKLQILQQAGTSMLAQANTSSQGVLSLLR